LSQDPIYDAIRTRIQEDVRPVRPLQPAWRRAFIVPLLFLLLGLLVVGLKGLRVDRASVGLGLLSLVTLVQFGFSFFLAASALRLVIPGNLPPRSRQFWLLSLIALVFAGASILIARRSDTAGDAGPSIHAACLFATIGLGLLPALGAFALGVRALPIRPLWFGFLSGLAAGLGAEAAWRLHCEFASPAHVFGAHGSAIMVLGGLGLLAGAVWQRRVLKARRVPNN
jgi:hypothetical protein